MSESPKDLLGYAFGATVAAGGIMGFVKKRSVPSLAAGLVFGSLACAGAYHATQNPGKPYVGAGVSALLTGVMGARSVKSGQMIPGGVIALVSLGMMTKYSVAIYQGQNTSSSED